MPRLLAAAIACYALSLFGQTAFACGGGGYDSYSGGYRPVYHTSIYQSPAYRSAPVAYSGWRYKSPAVKVVKPAAPVPVPAAASAPAAAVVPSPAPVIESNTPVLEVEPAKTAAAPAPTPAA